MNQVTGVLPEFWPFIQGPDKEIQAKFLANKFGKLAQGLDNRIQGTDTIFFVPKQDVPFATNKLT